MSALSHYMHILDEILVIQTSEWLTRHQQWARRTCVVPSASWNLLHIHLNVQMGIIKYSSFSANALERQYYEYFRLN